MTQLPRLDGFDVKAAVARMLGEPALWWQALSVYEAHFGHWDAEWQLVLGDTAAERRKVHVLRSAAGNIGAVRLALDAEVFENFLLAYPGEVASPMAEGLRRRLQHEFELAREGVRRTLAARSEARC